MNRRRLSVVLLLLLLPTSLWAEKPPAPMDMEAAIEAMDAATQPGEHHQFLAQMAGEWVMINQLWMTPGQPPVATTGTSTKAMIMNGRYLQDQTYGEMMGTPFFGLGITAYDNAAGEFVSTWIDTMSTAIAVARGQRDGDTLTLTGAFLDPVSKEEVQMRQVHQVVNPDHHTFTLYMTMPGLIEQKSVQMDFKRKKEE